MNRTWILAANASRGRFFERREPGVALTALTGMDDPLGRAKGVDLASDRAGYEATGHGGGSAYAPHMDPRTKEHDSFARRLAGHLNDAIAAHHCEHLVVIASNPMLGEIKSHLSAQSSKALARTVPRDVLEGSAHELPERIEAALASLG